MSDTNLSALSSLAVVQQVSANNIANVNTDGFKSSSVMLESGPGDQGVRVAAIHENTRSGPMVNEVEGSNTDIATEMVGMIRTGHAFSANIAAIRVSEEMNGHLVNMMA
ncbi:MAG: flagellar basal body rod protein [Pseudodesulfovibrio sp.]|nr:flagellar basal body rod protein [Pseudodesulfovibrio sp.]